MAVETESPTEAGAGVDDATAPIPDIEPPADDPRVTWRPSPAGYAARLVVLAVIIGFVLTIPHLLPPVLVPVAVTTVVYMIVALSLNLLMGYTGQVSLGHAAFVGFGGFGAAYLMTGTDTALPWGVAIAGATVLGGLAALPLGAIALRVRGLYLALVTIAFGLLAQESVFNIRSLTGGGAGAQAPRPSFATGHIAYVYVCLAFLALVWLLDWRLTSSKTGRAVQALRDDERVAASWGINVTGFKLLAFTLSGAIAGLAGGLFAGKEQIVVATDFPFGLSLTFVLMTVVGGLGSRPGVVLGGIVFAALPTVLEQAKEAWTWWPFGPLWEPVIGAMLLILTLTLFPGGLAQQNEHLFRWLSFRKFREDKSAAVAGGTTGGA